MTSNTAWTLIRKNKKSREKTIMEVFQDHSQAKRMLDKYKSNKYELFEFLLKKGRARIQKERYLYVR